jgi:hypothetical protein
MPNLKDYVSRDIGNVFFNTEEFAEIVTIDGVPQTVVIDEDRLRQRAAEEYQGISTGMVLYYIPVSAFPKKPSIGSVQIFNGRQMMVEDVKEHLGVYEILLNQNRSE